MRKIKNELVLNGVIDVEVMEIFLKETDEIIEAYKQYKSEISLYNQALVRNFDRVTIKISSFGGSTACGSAILNRILEMQEMGIHVDTHCSFAYSMAFVIFVAGERRTGDKYSKFMNHGSSGYNEGFVEQIKYDNDFSIKCDSQFEALILDKTNMTKERVEMARLKNDWILYEDAIELGIVNYGFEGAEIDWEELEERYKKASAVAIHTFMQAMESDEEETLYELLFLALADMMDKDRLVELFESITEELDEENDEKEKDDKKEESVDVCKEKEEDGCDCEEPCDGYKRECKCHKEEEEEREADDRYPSIDSLKEFWENNKDKILKDVEEKSDDGVDK